MNITEDDMTKEELLRILTPVIYDEEAQHARADKALLEYINDPEITEAFDKLDKWYA